LKILTTLTLIFLIFLSGCFGDIVKKDVQSGITKKELTDSLGQYDGYKSSGDFEVLSYVNKTITHWNTRGKADYFFIFKNDALVEWGTGDVRETVTSSGVIMFSPIY